MARNPEPRQHAEERALLGLIPLLTLIGDEVRKASPRWTCGTCGCLLYADDATCPKCRVDLESSLHE